MAATVVSCCPQYYRDGGGFKLCTKSPLTYSRVKIEPHGAVRVSCSGLHVSHNFPHPVTCTTWYCFTNSHTPPFAIGLVQGDSMVIIDSME